MMAQKTGISAKNFQDTFGFGSYQTTWGWLHKLRSVMVVPGRGLLSGGSEVDETYVGGQKTWSEGSVARKERLPCLLPLKSAKETRQMSVPRLRGRQGGHGHGFSGRLRGVWRSASHRRLKSYLGAQRSGIRSSSNQWCRRPLPNDDAMSHVQPGGLGC
jgi:hypothetical protein